MFEQVSRSTQKEILNSPKKRLNIGCGVHKLPGDWVRVDYDDLVTPDVKHDLTETPWPFETDYADVVWSSHVIEHLPDHKPFLQEIHRISKHGAKFVLMFPHYSRSPFSNQHVRSYGIKVLSGYEGMFKIEKIKLKYTWWRWRHWYKIPAYLLLTVIEFFANLSPEFWERVWCYWFGGFDQVIIEARVVKDKEFVMNQVHKIQ